MLTTSEKIKLIAKRRNKPLKELASDLGYSYQNLSAKLKRNNFTEAELKRIAKFLDCSYSNQFVMNDTKDTF